MRIPKAFAATVLLALVAGSEAQTFPPGTTYEPAAPERRGQAGMTYLQIGTSARAEALGGAFSAIRGDAASIFYNPAGMAEVSGVTVFAGHTSWIGDAVMTNLVVSGHYRNSTVGGTFQSMDYGLIEGTIIDDNPLGYKRTEDMSANAWVVGGFLAARLTDRFNAGAHLKYAVQDFGASRIYSFFSADTPNRRGYLDKYHDNRIGTWLLDLGTQYDTGLRNITINMAFQHFGRAKKFVEVDYDMPLTYRIGVSGDLDDIILGDAFATQKLVICADGVDRRNVPLDFAIGVEYGADLSAFMPGVKVALRAGRRAARHEEGWFSAGAGLEMRLRHVRTTFDYSYSDYGILADIHRLGLSMSYR